MLQRFAFLLLFSCFGLVIQAQENCFTCNFDSLLLEVNKPQPNEQKVRLLQLLIDKSGSSYLDMADSLIGQLLEVNKKVNIVDTAPYQHYKRALNLWGNNDLPAALNEFKTTISLFDKQHRSIYELLSTVRSLFVNLNMREELRSYYQNQLSYYLINGPYQNTASCYHALGWYFLSKADYNLAITNYLRAASVYKKFQPNYYYNELTVVGGLYEKWGNPDKANQYLNQALPLSIAKGDSNIATYALVALARISLKNNKTAVAMKYTDSAIRFSQNKLNGSPFNPSYASALLQKGLVYIHEQQPKLAFSYIFKARNVGAPANPKIATNAGELEIDYAFYLYNQLIKNSTAAEQYLLEAYKKSVEEKLNPLQKKYLRELSAFYEGQQKPLLALSYLHRYFDLNQTIENEQSSFKIAQYENEEKEKAQSDRILALRQEQAIQQIKINNRNVVTLLSLMCLVVTLALLAFIYRQLIINKKTLKTLRRTQRQLILSEKMASLGEMTAGVAHEIQNPMNFVKNFSEVSADLVEDIKKELEAGNVQEALYISDDIKENLGRIAYHTQRADSIVKGMLMHTRQSTGQKELVNINELTAEYLRLSYLGLRAADVSFNAELIKDLEADIPLIEIIPQEIGRVLINLFNNAFYSVKEKRKKLGDGFVPTISVSTHMVDENVEIKIRDNGMGIPHQIVEKIFQPFYTTKPTGQGTGLGLSLSYDIIAKGHGGRLEVNTQEGEYAEFVITLPST